MSASPRASTSPALSARDSGVQEYMNDDDDDRSETLSGRSSYGTPDLTDADRTPQANSGKKITRNGASSSTTAPHSETLIGSLAGNTVGTSNSTPSGSDRERSQPFGNGDIASSSQPNYSHVNGATTGSPKSVTSNYDAKSLLSPKSGKSSRSPPMLIHRRRGMPLGLLPPLHQS